ncbi:M48 family metallopeptidase [Megamonas hypermegale]|uniref:M48 family metallopeptidase n=1 Tax=Megamonas hypermegale TaxID=158847 RepID=UPI0032090B6D
MLKKTYKKWLSSAIVLSLGVTLSYGAVPAKPAEAFNWSNLAGAVFVTTAQQQQLEKQLNYLDSDGRHEYFNKIKSELGENQDYYYNAILDDIMNRLTYVISLEDPSINDKPYNYFVNNDETYNAFCTVGHNLTVNTGMFKLLNNNQDELAVVVAHELAHGQEEHVQSSAKKSFSINLLANIYASQNPDILSVIGTNILAGNMKAKGITKRQEQQADDIAFEYTVKAGYNIGAGAATWQRFIDKMGVSKTNFVGELFSPSDHPSHQSRRDNYSEKLTEYSNDKVEVDEKTGMIRVNRRDFIIPAAANDMSSQERAYLIAGNLAAVYHATPKNPPKAHLEGDTIYMGRQAIMVVEYGENGRDIVDYLNAIR